MLRLAQRGQEQARENRDDGNDDQEFDEGETDVAFGIRVPRRCDRIVVFISRFALSLRF